VHAPGRGILHQDEKHVLRSVDHQIDPGGAVPLDLAERARRRRHRIAGIGADAEAIAEPEAVAGIVEIIARHAGARTDVICRHRRERGGPQISPAVQAAAIE
jgi:hypothetical protein